MESKMNAKVAKSSARSIVRIARARSEVSRALAQKDVQKGLENVVRPRSPSSGMRKVGIALMLAPDPLTDIPGIALLASAHLIKRRDPLSIERLMKEARRVIKDVESLSV